MNVNFLKLSFLVISLVLTNFSFAQNPGWIFSPQYFPDIFYPGNVFNLPNSITPQSASNIQMDAQGNILFYVIDKVIFDKDGIEIGRIGDNLTPYNCLGLASTSEIVIIQDPNDCNIYYVFCNVEAGCSGDLRNVNPYYSIVDFNQFRPNSTVKGKITLTRQLPYSPQAEGKWYGNIYGNFLAASTLKLSGDSKYRLLFVNDPYGNRIVRYKLDSNGLIFNGTIPYQYTGNTEGFRAEMELIDLPNGRMRIATPYSAGGIRNGKKISSAIFTAELDTDGIVYNNQINTLYFYTNPSLSNDIPYIHGLEFSPNGDNLFISHMSTSMHIAPFEYYSFSNPNMSDPQGNGVFSVNMNGANSDFFQFSQIEYINNKLYLGSLGRLASFSNPNTPNTGVFTDYAITLPNYTSNDGNPYFFNNSSKLYTLQDQIDGMVYQNFTSIGFDLLNYTAINSATWQQGVGNNPWGISGNTVYIENELVIPTGKIVTIKNMTFHFGQRAKVIIQPGAKLVVDNTIFTSTNTCNNTRNFWHGVEVWGTTNQHQSPESNPTYQGRFELINGGMIENADLGVINWKEDDFNKIGGIIYSNGGVFKNNRRDVSFIAYDNFNPNNPNSKISDFSKFQNTDFIWDANFIPNNYTVLPHVTLWGVHGINITNCRFTNTRAGDLAHTIKYKAIYSIDASYTVGPSCSSMFYPCPSSNLLKSTFTGYHTAIEASGSGTTKTITVSQSNFNNNINGIVINEFNNVSINRNNISIGSANYMTANLSHGISLTNSTGYLVEENTISTTLNLAYASLNRGIFVDNSGIANNRLYKNTLNGLYTGNIFKGINRDAANSLKGLQFLCNSFMNNRTAVRVENSTASHGIRPYQGEYSPLKSAGNIFTNNTFGVTNTTIAPISYYHNGSNTLPTNNTANVTPYLTSNVHACPTSFGSGLIVLGMKNLQSDSLENTLNELEAAQNDLLYTYIALIDGGNTDELKTKVENSLSNDVWELRSILLEKTPYLSEELLLEVAKSGNLPNAMLLEICLANPDATKNVYFLEKLKEVTNGSFPSYMETYIRNAWDLKTVRTQLEAQIGSLESELSNTRNYINHEKAMSDEYSAISRYEIVKNANTISEKISQIDYFIETSQWRKADSVLQFIKADKFSLDNIQLVEDFDAYINFRSNLGKRNLAQLNDSEIDLLKNLAIKKERVAGYARNILCYFYEICYENDEENGSVKKKQMNNQNNEIAPALESLTYSVKLYPNPAQDYVNIQWEIFDQLQNCHYQLVDLNGVIIKKGAIEKNVNEITLDTRSLSAGYYIVSIYNNDVLRVSKKIEVNSNK